MATIDGLYTDFQNEVARTRGLVVVAEDRPQFQGNLVVELALLRGVGSWEVLMGEAFLAYMLGKTSRSGLTYQSVLRRRISEAKARTALLGGRDYLDWLGRDRVLERGARWFPGDDGFVTASIAPNVLDLKDIRIVRNRIAHNSGDARSKFGKLRNLHIPNAANRRGMGPGQFLRAASSYSGLPCTRFERYLRQLEHAADVLTA
jgi:hypothetical protein